ncbi:MAG: hypothetical protein LBF79_05290 [Dysgonamonadaceae bacterium]|jgi:hypothetical protein|nr:hypothetical protein [Dysgonamonadaceae bacterium]
MAKRGYNIISVDGRVIEEGDRIRFLNDVGGGTVRRFEGNGTVIVEEDNGFEISVPVRECIVTEKRNRDLEVADTAVRIPQTETLAEIPVSRLREAMMEKNVPNPCKKRPDNKPQDIRQPLEIDLHIGQLVDNTRGMSNKDMLDYQLDTFRKIMNNHRTKKGQRIVFIHGKGDGVLRTALLGELRLKYPKTSSQDAPFHKYGFGATLVTI